jgi:hypothetical protein
LPPTTDRVARSVDRSEQTPPTRVEAYLLPLIDAGRAVGDVPILGSADWCGLDRRDPRSTASVARGALLWWQDGQPAAIEARLRAELAEADRLAVWRTRAAWAEFEDSWREFRRGREHMVSFAELERRRGGVL